MRDYTPYLVISYNEKESEKVIYIYKTVSLCCTAETNTTLWKKKKIKKLGYTV